MKQPERAAHLRALHHAPPLLLLPNAWDAGSARLLEAAGCRALATTSSGVAHALGRPDGEFLSRAEMIDAIGRIARSVEIPVSADLERGYGETAAEVGETIRMAIETGVVGVNLEDGVPGDRELRPIDAQCERLAAARHVADASGVPIFINARIDVWLRGAGDPDQRLDSALARADAYLGAGADGIFTPGVVDPALIEALAGRIEAPLNVFYRPGLPTVSELERLGVSRLTLGGAAAVAALGLLRRIVIELQESGTYSLLADPGITYAELQQVFAKDGEH